MKAKQPAELEELPSFLFDALEGKWSGGDVCIQACTDDPQVAFHAVRNLVRIARGTMQLKWTQAAFQRTKQANTEEKRRVICSDSRMEPTIRIIRRTK